MGAGAQGRVDAAEKDEARNAKVSGRGHHQGGDDKQRQHRVAHEPTQEREQRTPEANEPRRAHRHAERHRGERCERRSLGGEAPQPGDVVGVQALAEGGRHAEEHRRREPVGKQSGRGPGDPLGRQRTDSVETGACGRYGRISREPAQIALRHCA